MNKTVLIAVGSSAASLAAGAAGGYFFAKKKFEEQLRVEIEATKKHYGVLMTNMQYGQKPSLEDVVSAYSDEEDPIVPEEDEDDEPVELPQPVATALTNYQGFAEKPAEGKLVESNIFSNQTQKPPLPPRDPGTGKFVPSRRENTDTGTKHVIEPEMITEHAFMINDVDGAEFDQESVLYFTNEDTVVEAADYNAVVDNSRIGQIHLEKLRDGKVDVIYVRNAGLQIDYQVTRTSDSLVEAMGFGESEEDFDEIDAAEHRTARDDETANTR